MNKKILFISHVKAQCGVYEYGRSISDVLQHSRKYEFIRAECSSLNELKSVIKEKNPDAIIYNYYPSVLPWVATQKRQNWWMSNIATIKIPQIGIIHEITQEVADTATNYRSLIAKTNVSYLSRSLFDYYIAPDPTLFLRNPFVYKTGRLIPRYKNEYPLPSTPVIGSFGFATPKKGFEKVVQLVQDEFDEATIRFNIPAADFGEDKEGKAARSLAQKCRSLIVKPGIQLIVTHDFFDTKSMLDFLAQNSVNVFLYEHDATSGKGISSAIDNAMAVQRPIAISEAVMFRHIVDAAPTICMTKSSLKTIIKNGFTPLKKYYDEWNEENLLWEYERIMDSIFQKEIIKERQPWNPVKLLKRTVKGMFNKPDSSFQWLRDSEDIAKDDFSFAAALTYQPIEIPKHVSFNRILDDKNRLLYKQTIQKLKEYVPNTMAKKIPEANVQQAFVFDTVYRYLSNYKNPKILCVGSYEDTAAMSLKKMGIQIEEIDPTYNYSLQEYCTKPSTRKNSYDIIFSTSVIEHDPDDESFVKCIADLLAYDGIAIMTCDYKDGWTRGEPKPECNERFYTQNDLKNRLLPLMHDCHLIDEPQWDCPNPDFNYLGKYQYTFATFAVKKNPKK
jgi:SAM-dependent methyltransferase